MAEVTTALIKELRELTGAGILACKNALVETEGDMDAAVEILRKKGEAQAVKKASRIAAEGLVRVVVRDNTAVMVEVNSETDFVAKNEKFQKFVDDVVESIFASDAADVDALMNEKFAGDPSKTVGEALVSIIATIGEKITIRRFVKIKTDGVIVPYIHGGGRIGVLAEANALEGIEEAMKNIAMQVAAMNPQYIAHTDMTDEEVAKLREITVDSALNTPESLPAPLLKNLLAQASEGNLFSAEDAAQYEEQKNNLKYIFNFLSAEAKTAVAGLAMNAKETITADKIFNGLVEGRVSKQLKEICLLDQTYVKAEDGKQTVAQYLKAVNPDLSVKQIVRFEVGEGIEKRQENFAEEVAKQMA
ncbi:MAG: elongation factor Ts [Lachnospiraceae bacterium]|nr:elongation factor Ts [Lachnospiraceae bacterium]MBR3361744.1 elongation factor Ts [Lachnospiraceae bacterium]MBR6356740.1 elongation factor Ts [Lachnospiraceae bacterium]MBR7076702.1 elongation factor Ts [Lachnospiraceae bacterium]